MVAWRKCVRRLLGLNIRTHCNLLPEISGLRSIDIILHQRRLNYICKCLVSENDLVKTCAKVAISGQNIGSTFGISNFTCFKYGLRNERFYSKYPPKLNTQPSEHTIKTANFICTLTEFLPECSTEDAENIRTIIDYLCTE